MAQSPAHRFGQIIGDVLETAIEPILADFARQHSLFLDKKGPRPARKGRKVSWTDSYGNIHDLDYVLERGGSATEIGIPVAFIETAWRRYTKHSRNKAQEIQGAILPLAATHQSSAPFLGTILAGVFTEGALRQLESQKFRVLYFPYDSLLSAFKEVRIDASFDEDTPDSEVQRKVSAWERLAARQRSRVANALLESHNEEVRAFMINLESSVTRYVASIRVLPLHGVSSSWKSADEAIVFIKSYDDFMVHGHLVRLEISIVYNNEDEITGKFATKEDTLAFLENYRGPQLAPANRRQSNTI
ncbi:MAG: DNA methylase [Chloroflexi bacterium]|nr:DNA methylase [Chloroflexota bacterium]